MTRERLEPLLRSGGVRRPEDTGERAMAAIAKRAVGDLVELRSLSGAVVLIEASYARCLDDLDALLEKGVPVARRRDGWSFLLADAEDMQRLNRVTLDGETVLAQMAGELVDVSALSWASEVADVLAPQVAQFHHLLESTGAERVEDLGIPATILQGIASSCEREESREPRF